MRPKKQEDVDGRIVIARNVHWELPQYLRHAIDSPIAVQRRNAVDGLVDLHRRGNERVRASSRTRSPRSPMTTAGRWRRRPPRPWPACARGHRCRRGRGGGGAAASWSREGRPRSSPRALRSGRLPRGDQPGDGGPTAETATASPPSTSAPPQPVPGLPSSAPLSGDSMVFSWEVDRNADLYLVDVATNTLGQRLTTDPQADFAPLISPDRGSIVYMHAVAGEQDQLRVIAADGSGDRPLFAEVPAECAGQLFQPAWNPADSTVLVISCGDADGNRPIQLVTVDGQVIRELESPGEVVDDLTFSHDGGRLAFWAGPGRCGTTTAAPSGRRPRTAGSRRSS